MSRQIQRVSPEAGPPEDEEVPAAGRPTAGLQNGPGGAGPFPSVRAAQGMSVLQGPGWWYAMWAGRRCHKCSGRPTYRAKRAAWRPTRGHMREIRTGCALERVNRADMSTSGLSWALRRTRWGRPRASEGTREGDRVGSGSADSRGGLESRRVCRGNARSEGKIAWRGVALANDRRMGR